MSIEMDRRFIYIGVSSSKLNLKVPFPTSGKAAFETSRFVDSTRNANGVVVGQQVGRSIDKQNMAWAVMDCEIWWEINRYIERNGMFFYCKYFSHNFGEWRTRKFYCSDFKCTPALVDPSTGKPTYYKDCSFNVIDVGA